MLLLERASTVVYSDHSNIGRAVLLRRRGLNYLGMPLHTLEEPRHLLFSLSSRSSHCLWSDSTRNTLTRAAMLELEALQERSSCPRDNRTADDAAETTALRQRVASVHGIAATEVGGGGICDTKPSEGAPAAWRPRYNGSRARRDAGSAWWCSSAHSSGSVL